MHLIDQIKKGANNFATYVKKIIDDFFKWLEDLFKSGKADEVFEGIIKLSDEAEILLKKYADNAILGYTKLQRPTVVSVLEGNGKRVFAYSNKAKLAASLAAGNSQSISTPSILYVLKIFSKSVTKVALSCAFATTVLKLPELFAPPEVVNP